MILDNWVKITYDFVTKMDTPQWWILLAVKMILKLTISTTKLYQKASLTTDGSGTQILKVTHQ